MGNIFTEYFSLDIYPYIYPPAPAQTPSWPFYTPQPRADQTDCPNSPFSMILYDALPRAIIYLFESLANKPSSDEFQNDEIIKL